MRRTGPRGVRHLSKKCPILFVSLLPFSPCSAFPHLSFLERSPGPIRLSLVSREEFEYPKEHVVLADCTQGEERYLSSQMAYYEEEPGPRPVDVASVTTAQPGKNALWINSITSATFFSSNIYFEATIGPVVPDGAYAGYGHNGIIDGGVDKLIHNFNCWKQYQYGLYEWQNALCSMIYKCNHDPRPENATDIAIPTSTPSSGTPGASSLPTSGSGSNGTVPGDTEQPASTGLSPGALIGTIVGSVGALVIAGLLGVWLLLRRRSSKKAIKKDLDSSEERHEADDGTALGKGGGGGYDDKKQPPYPMERQEMDTGISRFEMDTEAHRFEMDNTVIAELDGTAVMVDKEDLSGTKQYDVKAGGDGIKKPLDHKGGDVKKHHTGELAADNAVFEEPKTMMHEEPKTMMHDEPKARAIDKGVIRASLGAGSASDSRWTEKKEAAAAEQTNRDAAADPEIPPRAVPVRTQTTGTTWTTWTTDSETDLAGFPLVMNPVSPISPSEQKPPNG